MMLHGMTDAEIVKHLGTSITAVRMNRSRAVSAIKQWLRAQANSNRQNK